MKQETYIRLLIAPKGIEMMLQSAMNVFAAAFNRTKGN